MFDIGSKAESYSFRGLLEGFTWRSLLFIALYSFTVTHEGMAQAWKPHLSRADSLFAVNSTDSAIVVASTALLLAENELGADDLALVEILERIGNYQEKSGKLAEAESTLTRALTISEEKLGANHLDIAGALDGVAKVYLRRGRYIEAETCLNRGLEIRKRNLPLKHPDLAKSNFGLASLNFIIGNFVKAADFGQIALAIWQDTADSNLIGVHVLLGNISSNIGLFSESEFNYRKAAEISQDLNGPNHPVTANALTGLANLYYSQGKLAEAEHLYEQILEVFKQSFGPDHTDVARIMINLGLVYQGKGMYSQAEQYYSLALPIMEKNLGPGHLGYAWALAGLASAYLDQGRYDEADSLLRQALAIQENKLGPKYIFLSSTLDELAEVNLKRGELEKAAEYTIRALDINEVQYGSDHPKLAGFLVRLGEIRANQGLFQEAELIYTKAIKLHESLAGYGLPFMAECLELLSDCYRQSHQPAKCLESGRRSVEIRRKNLFDFVEVVPEKDALIYSQHLRNSINNYISCNIDFGFDDKETRTDVANIMLSTKGQISDAIFERKKQLKRLLQTAESLRLAKYEVSQLYVAGPSESIADYRHEVDSLTAGIDRMEAELAFNNSGYRIDINRRTVTSQRIARLIPPEAAVIEYVLVDYLRPGFSETTPRYIAAIITAKNGPVIVDLGNAEDINILIDSYRQELLRVAKLDHLPTNPDLITYKNNSTKLFQKVFGPIENYLNDKQLIFVAPDGGLNLVSFAGLFGKDDKYLIEKYSIQYLSSARDLIRLKEESTIGKGLFAVGDPDYDASALNRLSEFNNSENASEVNVQYASTRNIRSGCSEFGKATVARLPGTRTEVEHIGLNWQNSNSEPVTLCFGSNASEEKFKAKASGNRVIHLATHGYFLEGACIPKTHNRAVGAKLEISEENPLLLSGLFFAGANLHGQGSDINGAEDGVLTAYEVAEMNLEGTDMVVLSACETGLGEVKEGEGVYGLRRAFQLAGARTVVSALWPVSDKETATMMSEIYKESAETLPEKMRRIQLAKIAELRKAGLADHPFTWAAFIAIGDWK